MRLQMSTSLSSGNETGFRDPLRSFESERSARFKPAPSLNEIENQFKNRRDENVRRLFDIITQVYPNMDKLEAIKLAEMF